jgi:hypothetical protein
MVELFRLKKMKMKNGQGWVGAQTFGQKPFNPFFSSPLCTGAKRLDWNPQCQNEPDKILTL